MPEAVKPEHPHIVRLGDVCGGEPAIDGVRVTVRHVATLHRRWETILDIAEALGITEAQVFHALSYFFDHRDEILALAPRTPRPPPGRGCGRSAAPAAGTAGSCAPGSAPTPA
jgi:uncharacterized protein (DUF433 family)